jgi:hypothetical protein
MNVHVVIDDVEVAERAIAGGATVVQVRLKDAGTAARAAMGSRLRHLPAMLVINDDVEAALQCRADGATQRCRVVPRMQFRLSCCDLVLEEEATEPVTPTNRAEVRSCSTRTTWRRPTM